MAFGAYIHIPYCLQRCTYCDFATYEFSKIQPPEEYVERLKKEISLRSHFFSQQSLDTLYFGGGTPSLIDASLIVSLIQHLEKVGFPLGPKAEVTLEINPATVSEEKLKVYLDAGINRFSVGAQTFDNRLLKSVAREHSAEQTLETLALLAKYELNFSFDILFALPGQTLAGLEKDVQITLDIGPQHISPYCLTVPPGHPLSKGRPPEEEQVEMFELIRTSLFEKNYRQYEISNFAKPGFESRHNLLYWTNQSWMAFGLSAHGYKQDHSPYGMRFWNLSNINDYSAQIDQLEKVDRKQSPYPAEQFEALRLDQALTDYCHTSLRIEDGLSLSEVEKLFGTQSRSLVQARLASSLESGHLQTLKNDRLALTPQGIVLSNLVFEKAHFLPADFGA